MTFNRKEFDIIKKALTSGIRKSAFALSELFDDLVEIDVSKIIVEKLLKAKEFLRGNYSKYTAVHQDFFGKLEGKTYIIFANNAVKSLLNYLEKKESIEKDFTNDILLEISNIITNNLMGAIVDFLGEKIDYSLPEISVNKFSELKEREDYYVLIVNSVLKLKKKNLKINFLIIFSIKTFDIFKELFLKVIEKNGEK